MPSDSELPQEGQRMGKAIKSSHTSANEACEARPLDTAEVSMLQLCRRGALSQLAGHVNLAGVKRDEGRKKCTTARALSALWFRPTPGTERCAFGPQCDKIFFTENTSRNAGPGVGFVLTV